MKIADLTRMFVKWDDTQHQVLDIVSDKEAGRPGLKSRLEFLLWESWFLADHLYLIRQIFYEFPHNAELQENLPRRVREFLNGIEKDCPEIVAAIKEGKNMTEAGDPNALIDPVFQEEVEREISRII